MSEKHLPFQSVLTLFPQLTENRLKYWTTRNCAALGRKLRTIPGRPYGPKNALLYSVKDVELALRSYHDAGKLPDHFVDARGHWLWVKLVVKKPYYFSVPSIYSWNAEGCAPLGGHCIQIERKRGGGRTGSGRDYVRKEDLDTILKWRCEQTRLTDPSWLTQREAERLLARELLIKYSDSKDHRRQHDGTSHPALNRPIRTVPKLVVNKNGRSVWIVVYWKPDIEAIATVTAPAQYARLREACKEFNLTSDEIRHAVDAGSVHRERFAGATERGRPTSAWHYLRENLKTLSAAKHHRGAEPDHRHGEILERIDKRTERIEKTAETSLDIIMVNGKPTPVPAVMPRKPRVGGAPKLSEEKDLIYRQIWNDWLATGGQAKDFYSKYRLKNGHFLGRSGFEKIRLHVKRHPK